MAATVVPQLSDRPQVFPTARLLLNGMLQPELRKSIRKIQNFRNAVTVVLLWSMVIASVWASVWWGNPAGYLACFIAMGPLYVRFAILMHESAHKLLFSNKWWNDFVGKWFIAYPAFTPIGLYRKVHFAHHKDEFGPNEPDIAFYGGYPCTKETLRRRLIRDACGISGWKNFTPLIKSLRSPSFRPIGLSILAVQGAMWAISFAFTGLWWIYPVMWWGTWMTQWRVLNRLRSIAEHGGMQRGDDRRVTTHHANQHLLARIWLVPYYTGWHLAHHVDMGVPWRNLPRFHKELLDAGYVTDAITYKNYRALWKDLSSLGEAA